MKGLFVFAAILALLAPAVALDREAFTITRYDLNLRLEPSQQRLGVRGLITLRNDSSSPQRLIPLQISSSLGWRSIRLLREAKPPAAQDASAGEAVQFLTQPYTSDIDHTGVLSEAIVTLPQEVAPKASIELAIGYEGLIVLDFTRLKRVGTPEQVARHSDWDQIGHDYTAVRGVGYVTWYPVAMEAQNLLDGGSMFAALGKWKARHALSQMKLSIELVSSESERPSLLVNGKDCAESVDAVSETSAQSRLQCDGLRVGNPVLLAGSFSGVTAGPVHLDVIPEHAVMADEFGKLGDRAALLVKDWFGPAREQPHVVDLPDGDAAPFEAGDWLLLPLAKARPEIQRALLIHQLTHAAFPSPRLWIFEGAAHFGQIVAEEKNGRDAALALLKTQSEAVAQAEKTVGAGEPLIAATGEVFYRSKAVLVWWMLRDMLGDEALKKTLHAYRAEEDTEPAYFQHLLESESKRDLAWFFHDWVYTDSGLPDFIIETASARLTHGTNYITAVSVANHGAAGAEVAVTIHTDAGDFAQRLEVRGKAKAVTRITTPAEPLEVIVNDGSVPESGETGHRLKISTDGG